MAIDMENERINKVFGEVDSVWTKGLDNMGVLLASEDDLVTYESQAQTTINPLIFIR